MIKILGFVLIFFVGGCNSRGSSSESYTLYRNSMLDISSRIHISTFDSVEGEAYNKENCDVASDLFKGSPGVQNRFWCEKGFFKK